MSLARPLIQPARRWLTRKRLLALAALALGVWLLAPALVLLDDGPALVALARLGPRLGGLRGPITLLVLVQNEDELRATGGYITAVGTLTLDNGRLVNMDIEDSFAVDDPSLLYPAPPDPLRVYMAAPIWLLRDVNWSADLPSVGPLAEALYTATRPGPVDGVLTLDQTALQIMLRGTGPIRVEGFSQPVTANNLFEMMRAAREPEPGEGVSYEWWLQRKDFMPQMARAMLRKLPWASWPLVANSAIRALDERHVQIWLKDPEAAAILAERGWDGALRPAAQGDYLLVVEANVGFNKVNAIREAALAYTADLTDPDRPVGRLTATYTNPAEGAGPCDPGADYGDGRYATLVNRCYWNYVRAYVPESAELLSADMPAIPTEWLEVPEAPTGSVNVWPEPGGVQSFGTLLVVPFGAQHALSLEYTLGPEVLAHDGATTTYHLRVQKQPGTLAVPLTVTVQLPPGAQLVSAAPRGRWANGAWTVSLDLQRDRDLRVTFRVR